MAGEGLACCVPMSGICSMEPILKSTLLKMIKVNCSSATCTESGFIHPDCFNKLEESLIRYVSTYQWSNSHKQESMKKYNWSVDHEREYLWKLPWIFSIISKKLSCPCGSGYLKKDLGWPPVNWRKNAKKVKSKPKDSSSLPRLSHDGGKVRYIPSVVPEYPDTEVGRGHIPGAVFADNNTKVKRGVIVSWVQGVGQIRNLVNKEERMCQAKDEVVVGREKNMEMMVGSEVEYKTEKKGKKLEAVMVKLVKTVEWRKGIVTHWVPEELAGVIKSQDEEVLVYRSEFVPGGFAPDIVGKTVRFKFERARLEATCVRVELVEELVDDRDKSTGFTDHDLIRCPQLSQALCEDSTLVRNLATMSKVEQSHLLDQLEQFIPSLANHNVGYRVVLEMIRQFNGVLLERLVRILSREFFSLAQTKIGAKSLVYSLTNLSMDLQNMLVQTYGDMTNSEEAMSHVTGVYSRSVFQASLPVLDSSLLRHLVLLLVPQLQYLAGHPSLAGLVDYAALVDQHILFIVADHLDAQNLLLHDEQHDLVVQLVSTGNVKVCGLLLHTMSGKLSTVANTENGRHLLSTFIRVASDLQVELVMEELCQDQGHSPPLIMQLVLTCNEDTGLREAVVAKARREILVKMLDIFKNYTDRLISSPGGKQWIGCVSKKVNSTE